MDITLLSIILVFSFVLFLMAFFKKHIILAIMSGVGFLLSGVWIWNGVKYVSETTIVQINSSTTTVTNTYSTWISYIGGVQINWVVGSFCILFGLFLLLVAGSMVYSKKGQMDFGDSIEQDEE